MINHYIFMKRRLRGNKENELVDIIITSYMIRFRETNILLLIKSSNGCEKW